jgi:serine phosphatase RsbU (regulator of sigma subunit)
MLMSRRAEFLDRAIAGRTAELNRAIEQVMGRDAEMLADLRAAGRLQTRVMLPHAPPAWPQLAWAVHFAPLFHLGGDYYDFASPGPDRIGVLIADASGHSIPAALVAIMARFAFVEEADFNDNPGDVLSAMNHRLQALAGRGFMLGIMPDERYAEREVTLRPGDRVCFYTDGLSEARNEIGELFGTDRLTECLTEAGRGSADEILQAVLAAQRRFSGSEKLTDDLTAVVMAVL